MKKNRTGFSIQAILPIEKRTFRRLWFDYSNTIELEKLNQGGYYLEGECSTTFGSYKSKTDFETRWVNNYETRK